MTYSNVKSGLSKLFLAEILTIISSFSIVFNGETVKTFGIVLSALGIAAFVINLVGLKQCALDDIGYKKAFRCTIAAIFVCLSIVILGVVMDNFALADRANEVQGVFNYLVAYMVLKTTADILRKRGKEAEAEYADKVRKLYTFAFIVSEVFGILSDTVVGSVVLILGFLLIVVAIIALLVAHIKYIIFLKKSSDAL